MTIFAMGYIARHQSCDRCAARALRRLARLRSAIRGKDAAAEQACRRIRKRCRVPGDDRVKEAQVPDAAGSGKLDAAPFVPKLHVVSGPINQDGYQCDQIWIMPSPVALSPSAMRDRRPIWQRIMHASRPRLNRIRLHR